MKNPKEWKQLQKIEQGRIRGKTIIAVKKLKAVNQECKCGSCSLAQLVMVVIVVNKNECI